MCYSLLLVTFKNDKARETKECATEQDEREKIADLRIKLWQASVQPSIKGPVEL